MSFDHAFATVVGEEGDFSNDPNDSGGETRFGVTEALARKYGYVGDMRELPFETAKDIYLLEFWTPLGLYAIDKRSPGVALELFDTGVNMGTEIAARFLQRCLNAFNNLARFYDDVPVDGEIGPKTIEAFERFIDRRGGEGEEVLLKGLNCLQGARYIELAESRSKDETFVYGWIKNRVELA